MKPNVAPEKIYIEITPDGTRYYRDVVKEQRTENSDIEYTRTDCFVENVQLFLIDKLKEIPMGGGKMKIKADCSLEEFIDEFQKYIKGE